MSLNHNNDNAESLQQSGATACLIDPAGTYSNAGASAPTTDLPGTYSDAGTSASTPADAGTYIPVSGATSEATEIVDPAGGADASGDVGRGRGYSTLGARRPGSTAGAGPVDPPAETYTPARVSARTDRGRTDIGRRRGCAYPGRGST